MANGEDKKHDPDEEAQLDAFLDLILDILFAEAEKKVMEEAKEKD